jgi:hypothetical protein
MNIKIWFHTTNETKILSICSKEKNAPSSVLVAQHAQQKLMRELDFINAQSPAQDAAITAYVDT